MSNNTNLHQAKKAKKDEFYTRYEDIEKELANYTEHFKGKKVYCNCDTPDSAFWRYFLDRFDELGIKRLTATHISKNTKWDYDGKDVMETKMEDNGDFRSQECIELLKQADIVVTNPMFSLFREYIKQLMDYNKKFIIIGNMNAITYKEVFPLIKGNRLWLGCCNPKAYITTLTEVENDKTQYIENGIVYQKFGNHCWFTNLQHNKRNLPLDLKKRYNAEDYPKYDNYLGFECSKTADIPMDEYIEIEIDEKDYPKWKEGYGDDVEIIEH